MQANFSVVARALTPTSSTSYRVALILRKKPVGIGLQGLEVLEVAAWPGLGLPLAVDLADSARKQFL
jgi:hypothetical protein